MHTLPQQRRAAPASSRCCASGSSRAAGHRQACQRSPSPAKAHASQHPHPRRTGVGLREGGMALALAAGAVQAGSRERARRAGLRPAKVKPPQAADAQGGGVVRMLGEGMAMAGCWHSWAVQAAAPSRNQLLAPAQRHSGCWCSPTPPCKRPQHQLPPPHFSLTTRASSLSSRGARGVATSWRCAVFELMPAAAAVLANRRLRAAGAARRRTASMVQGVVCELRGGTRGHGVSGMRQKAGGAPGSPPSASGRLRVGDAGRRAAATAPSSPAAVGGVRPPLLMQTQGRRRQGVAGGRRAAAAEPHRA